MTDDDLYKAMWQNIQQYENVIQHPYLDTKGLITVGGGANVNNWDDFKKVNFRCKKLNRWSRLDEVTSFS